MGNKLKTYIKALKQLIDSGEEIEDIDSFKLELMREIQFWQHERFIHLIVTVLFALLTMMVLLTLVFNASIPLFLLFVMLLVPTLMCLHLGVWPDGSVVAKAFFSIAILFFVKI